MSKIEFNIALTPAAQEIITQLNTYEKGVSQLVITSDEQRLSAMEIGKKIKTLGDKLEAERLATTRPMDEAKSSVMDLYRKPVLLCQTVASAVKKAVLIYDQEKQRQARELQLKLQREAEEAARKERERLEKLAQKQLDKGKDDKAVETLGKAEQVQAFVPVVTVETPKIKGESKRTNWKFEIIDVNQIPREYMIPNEKMIGEVARATKGALQIPGVKIYSEESLTF